MITASGIVTLCKRLYIMPDKSGLQSALIRHNVFNDGLVKSDTIQLLALEVLW